MGTRTRTGRTRAGLAAAGAALLVPGLVGFVGSTALAPGDTELVNLEHVYNFNPDEHDPDRHPSLGSDLEFFSHRVPLRDYETGAFVDRDGNPLPEVDEDGEPTRPVMAERDFAVMGSYQRGGYVFDITDPEDPQFVTQVTCRQDRNDVAITKMTDEQGRERVILALTQQSGNPCGDAGEGGVGVRVDAPAEVAGFLSGVQWGGTAAVDGQSAELVYAGTGCTPASYAPVAGDLAGNIALVDNRQSQTNPADQCPAATFFQKVQGAQQFGAIGFVQIPAEGAEPNGNATAVTADIPALEIERTAEALAVRDAVVAGETVEATLTEAPSDVRFVGTGSGGLGVFDITDPWAWEPLYRLRTGAGGVHNFIFHPTKPFGYVGNGALPGGINDIPIVDFTDLDDPEVLTGLATTEGGVHDVELSPTGDRAYAASENNYRIYDTTDPAEPVLLSRTPNVGSYAHGVFPSPDLSLMITNNESLVIGGFFAENSGVCPGEGLAAYDITDEAFPVGPVGYYVPDVVGQTDARACTSHFGRFAPGTKVLSMGWYIAGTRIVDWSDPSNPTELAAAVLEDTETWAAKFYKGPYVYVGDLGRGFDVFRWSGEGEAPWVREADLDVTTTGSSDRVRAGDPFRYRVEVTNHGPDDANYVTLVDRLPRGAEFVRAGEACSGQGGVVTCDLGTLAAGGSATVTILLRAPDRPGPTTNVATVDAHEVDPVRRNDRDRTETNVTGPPGGRRA